MRYTGVLIWKEEQWIENLNQNNITDDKQKNADIFNNYFAKVSL